MWKYPLYYKIRLLKIVFLGLILWEMANFDLHLHNNMNNIKKKIS